MKGINKKLINILLVILILKCLGIKVEEEAVRQVAVEKEGFHGTKLTTYLHIAGREYGLWDRIEEWELNENGTGKK